MARSNDFDRFLERTELTARLGHTLRGNRWTTAMAALHRIEAYVHGAAKQQARINRAAVEIQRRIAKDAIGPFARHPSDFRHFSRNTFSFGGEQIDISAKSLLRLRNVVESAVTVLKHEAEPNQGNRRNSGDLRNLIYCGDAHRSPRVPGR